MRYGGKYQELIWHVSRIVTTTYSHVALTTDMGLCHGLNKLSRDSKVAKFNLSLWVYQDIRRLDIYYESDPNEKKSECWYDLMNTLDQYDASSDFAMWLRKKKTPSYLGEWWRAHLSGTWGPWPSKKRREAKCKLVSRKLTIVGVHLLCLCCRFFFFAEWKPHPLFRAVGVGRTESVMFERMSSGTPIWYNLSSDPASMYSMQ